ncbi:unnamed protein product, partial [Closterium sp. Naga37s-1]
MSNFGPGWLTRGGIDGDFQYRDISSEFADLESAEPPLPSAEGLHLGFRSPLPTILAQTCSSPDHFLASQVKPLTLFSQVSHLHLGVPLFGSGTTPAGANIIITNR